MTTTPGWVRRNSFAAWTGYVMVLVGFSALAMTITAAGSGHARWAIVGAAVCAIAAAIGTVVLTTTVHSDHMHHRTTPNLIGDSWTHTR